MQNGFGHLPLRSRYYQGMLDLSTLEKGLDYTRLHQTYIIFLCRENLIPERGLHCYRFRPSSAGHPDIILEDRTERIFICAKGRADTGEQLSPGLKHLINYLLNHAPADDFTERLEQAVRQVCTHREWRLEYMTLQEKLYFERKEGEAR